MEDKEKEATISQEVEAPKEKLFKKPKVNMYKKHDDESDPEIEAFAKGELEKFHREKAETATVQKDTEASKEIASSDGMLLLQLNALKMRKTVSLRNVMTI